MMRAASDTALSFLCTQSMAYCTLPEMEEYLFDNV